MSTSSFIIFACWVIFILYWLISAFSVKRNISSGRGGEWQSGWWIRVTAAIVIILILHFFSIGSFNGGLLSQHWSPNGNPMLAIIGPMLCILGIALAIWARVHLGRNWSSYPTLKENHELVTSGPYALIRHPIYTGVILAAIGTTLVSWPWTIVLVSISIMFVWRVNVEEKLMMRQFPSEYPAYKKRTWALIPWMW